MSMIKGVIVESGDKVKIGGVHARQDSYGSIVGEICIYIQRANREGSHYVRCGQTGRWVVREADICPVKAYTTNEQAKQLLEVDSL